MTIAYMSDLPVHNTNPAADDYALPIRAAIPLLVTQTGVLANVTQSGTTTRVVATTVAQSFLATNTNRRGAVFANSGTTSLMLRFATGIINLTNFSVIISSLGSYTLPMLGLGPYTGPISGLWTAASGVGEGMATEWT
jgi:hypothetical protein